MSVACEPPLPAGTPADGARPHHRSHLSRRGTGTAYCITEPGIGWPLRKVPHQDFKFVIKGADVRTTLAATGVAELQIRRRMPWGPSASINTARWTRPAEEGKGTLEIEMQSGDVLQVEAEDARLEVT